MSESPIKTDSKYCLTLYFFRKKSFLGGEVFKRMLQKRLPFNTGMYRSR